jgi:phosphate starvation-inducible protein PhoH
MDELVAKKYGVEVQSLYQIDDLLGVLDPDLSSKLTPYIRDYQDKLREIINI